MPLHTNYVLYSPTRFLGFSYPSPLLLLSFPQLSCMVVVNPSRKLTHSLSTTKTWKKAVSE